MATLSEKKRELSQLFATISDTPAVDASCIIEHVTGKSKTQLIIDANALLSSQDEEAIDALAKERQNGKPIAYILGHKAFWTLDLEVTPDTLIPRPETECLVQWVLDHFKENHLKIADLGTGSGAIALALASEKLDWVIHATDQSEKALIVAKRNSEKYGLDHVTFYQGDWCEALPEQTYDLIISNPPYIKDNDPHLADLTFEPQSALTSDHDGLTAIRCITEQAKQYLKQNGVIVVEHGYDQAKQVCEIFEEHGYNDIKSHKDLSGTARFVTASYR